MALDCGWTSNPRKRSGFTVTNTISFWHTAVRCSAWRPRTSIFDIDDTVRPQYERLTAEHPGISFDEAYAKLLHRFEDKIRYRTISPRHFEAAAFRVCQILFEGRYSEIMQPMIHYIPLKKDFSNV